jgi:hypothetical protein
MTTKLKKKSGISTLYYFVDYQFYEYNYLIFCFFEYLFQNNLKKITFAELIFEV